MPFPIRSLASFLTQAGGLGFPLPPRSVSQQGYAPTRVSLKPGGKYICITPNRLTGPHDVSKYFEDVATGFHLKEYSLAELRALFAEVGFSELVTYIGGRGVFVRFPTSAIRACESILCSLPYPLRKGVSRVLLVKALLGIIVIAKK